jgi:tRNA(fMet)-specific endonuclease VapC
MSGNFLLDTNAVIAILRNKPLLSPLPSDRSEIAINCVVLGELIYGAFKARRRDDELTALHKFIADTHVHDCTSATSVRYAELKHYLAMIGNSLPENDIWIAASALEHGLTLVTRDAHFDAIPHLTKERW